MLLKRPLEYQLLMDSLRCPLCCSKEFICKKELINHLSSVYSNLKCPICREQSQDVSSLILHLENQCNNEPEISLGASLMVTEAPSATHPSENTSNNEEHPISDVTMDNSIANSRDNRVLPLRKRRKSNLSQLSKRKTLGKNNSDEYSQFTSESESKAEHKQSSSTSLVNSSLKSSQTTKVESKNDVTFPANADSILYQTDVSESATQPTPSSAAESEIDLDNVSMLSDESSFTTTNDYSSSQNEIISDDDCTENAVGFPNRAPFQSNSNRHAALFRNSGIHNQGSAGFINNLQVINNNFYTILLNNGSYEGNTTANHNMPQETNVNYQRRNTKNNNSQLNNSSQASSSSSLAEHGNAQHNVAMHNNFQAHKSCKNSNLVPINYTNVASSSISLPTSNIFIVANNSPHKYAVKNTNISNNIPVEAKEVSTANLASRNSARLSTSLDNSNTTEENTQVSQDDVRENDDSARLENTSAELGGSCSPVNETRVDVVLGENIASFDSSASNNSNVISSQSNHSLISRSNSNRMQKIQNADCIQNSTSSYSLHPSASALCKTNSFPLCNYIQSNQATNKSKLIKYNENHTGVKPRISNESELLLNNVQVRPNSPTGSAVNIIPNVNASSSDRNHDTSSSYDATINTTEDSSANSRTESNIQSIFETDEKPSVSVINVESASNSQANSCITSQNPNIFMCNNSETHQLNCNSSSHSYGSNCPEEINSRDTGATVDNSTSHLTGFDICEPSQANAFQSIAQNIPSTLNNLNNNATITMPATSQNICSLTNNLHKNKKSNLNQLGRRNVSEEEKLFTIGKVVSDQPSIGVASDTGGQGSYQMINNSIERNFNKLNTCSQEINAHKNVKTNESNKRNRKSKRPQSDQFGGRYYSEDLDVSSIANSTAGSSSSHVENSSASSSSSSVITPSTNTISSSSISEPHTAGANVFQDMNNGMQSNQTKTMFNNKSHHINKMDSTDKNISNVFNRKELVNIKRNNFNLSQQEHSNVRRSNSLNVKINDLTSGSNSSQVSDTKNLVRKSITKSNSFTIRNNICEPGTSQSFSEDRHYFKNLKNNISRTDDSDASPCDVISNDTPSNVHGRDSLEQFRLEEASNDCDIQYSSGDNHLSNETVYENQNDPLEAFSGLVLNNSMENAENHQGGSHLKPGCSSAGSGTVSSPRMIHNNIEPRCKKNKKCNEERGPLKPINSENKRKSTDQ